MQVLENDIVLQKGGGENGVVSVRKSVSPSLIRTLKSLQTERRHNVRGDI